MNLDDFSYFRILSIDKNKIDSQLNNFVVLVNLDSSIFDFSKCRDDGLDVVFIDKDISTLLDFERVFHDGDPSIANAQYWVKIPDVSSVSNTRFFMYYGLDSSIDYSDASAAWSSDGIRGVWHLEEEGDGTQYEYKDSTQYGSHGWGGDGYADEWPDRIQGKVGYGQRFNLPNDHISFDEGEPNILRPTNDITIRCCVLMRNAGSSPDIISFGNYNQAYTIYCNDSNYYFLINDNTCTANIAPSSTNFQHIVATRNGDTMSIYVDGEFVNDLTYDTAISYPSSKLFLGTQAWTPNMDLDEVMLTGEGVSASWVKADHASINDELLNIGEEINNILIAYIEIPTERIIVPQRNYIYINWGTRFLIMSSQQSYYYTSIIYGYLYNGYAATGGVDGGDLLSNKDFENGDWRVPSDSDYSGMVSYLFTEYGINNAEANVNAAGSHLKNARKNGTPILSSEYNTDVHPRWNAHATHFGRDTYNFSGKPGGWRSEASGDSTTPGAINIQWTNTIDTSLYWAHALYSNYGDLWRTSNNIIRGNSVRVVRDARYSDGSDDGLLKNKIYRGNDGKIYQVTKIGGRVWIVGDLQETKYNNGDWIDGFNSGVYTPISNVDWIALTEGALCLNDDILWA